MLSVECISSYKCRFVSLNTPINICPKASLGLNTAYKNLMLLTLTMFIVFDMYFIIYLPRELFDCQFLTKVTMSKASKFVKIFHINVSFIITSCAYKSKTLLLFNAKCLYSYPNEMLAVWYIFCA